MTSSRLLCIPTAQIRYRYVNILFLARLKAVQAYKYLSRYIYVYHSIHSYEILITLYTFQENRHKCHFTEYSRTWCFLCLVYLFTTFLASSKAYVRPGNAFVFRSDFSFMSKIFHYGLICNYYTGKTHPNFIQVRLEFSCCFKCFCQHRD